MKKAILSLLLTGSCGLLFAQTGDTTNMNGTMQSNTDYNAYSTYNVMVPSNINNYVMRDYPSAANVMWQQNGDWYHGVYATSGRYSHIYYNQAGTTYMVALPVTQTYVPDDVISRVGSMFGPAIYDIAALKGSEGQNIYHVRLIENGQITDRWIGDDGATVASPYRVETDMQMSSGSYSGMDAGTTTVTTETNTVNTEADVQKVKVKSKNGETKIKTKHADGTKTKTKVGNEQMNEMPNQ